jgi:hypothetical protein
MTQVYKAPNGRRCVILEGAKPANPHTLIDDLEKYPHALPPAGGTPTLNQLMQSVTENKLKAEHVIIQYVGPTGEHLGTEEVRKDSLTSTSETI